MDLGCFHKYIAFYAYINCCKTNSSLKRGNEKVAISNMNTIISNDIQKVWNIVLAVDKYNSWRSDLSKTEIDFTENVIPKKWFMKPFVKTYLKKQQKQFVLDLKKALE